MDRRFLDDVYRDFFGNSAPAGKLPTESPADSGKQGGKPDQKMEAFSEGSSEVPVPELPTSSEDALRHAAEALEEASRLFGSVNSASQETADFLTKSLDRLDAEYGDKFKKKAEEEFLRAAGELPDMPRAVSTGENQKEVKEEVKAEEPETDPMEELMNLTGLTTIKHDVSELADFVSVQKMRKDQGLKSVPVSLHLVFTGNPGTGKTTVARILGKIYKKIGVLSKGQLVETDRSGLVAGYVGQTAIKTQEKIQEALGGVLFIDEAYSLSQKDDAFGQEAIDTILKAMEDNRDDFVVVVAGYTKPMEKFINSNPGLKSRFNKYIDFPDYSVDELEAIFFGNCKKYDYVMEEDAKKHVREMIVAAKLTKTENFANAREVRNMFEKIITNQARRIRTMENPTHEDMITLTMEDLVDPAENPGKEPEMENTSYE